jgi:hypothetical protein
MGKAIECTHPLIIHSDCLGGSVESTLSPGPYFPRARAHARARDLAAGGGDSAVRRGARRRRYIGNVTASPRSRSQMEIGRDGGIARRPGEAARSVAMSRSVSSSPRHRRHLDAADLMRSSMVRSVALMTRIEMEA